MQNVHGFKFSYEPKTCTFHTGKFLFRHSIYLTTALKEKEIFDISPENDEERKCLMRVGIITTNALLTGSVNIARRCATKPRKAQRNEKQALMPLQVVLWNCMRMKTVKSTSPATMRNHVKTQPTMPKQSFTHHTAVK